MISALAIRFVFRVTRRISCSTGSESSLGISPSGAWVKSATRGSAKNASRMPEARARRAVNPALPAPGIDGMFIRATSGGRRQAEAAFFQRRAPRLSDQLLDELFGAGRVGTGAFHDARLVAHRRLRPLRQAYDFHPFGDDPPVGDIGE